jgi:cell wall-associated NlpC family hydrolase
MDRRLTPANDRAALEILRGKVAAPRYVSGEAASVVTPLTDLCRAPGEARDRQLLLGDGVTVIDRNDGWAFVQSGKDEYCGYVADAALGPATTPTHRVAFPATHLYPEARVQAHERASLSFGARVTVAATTDRFAETPDGFIPLVHLAPADTLMSDPVAVAEMFLGTPYLWGGNSRAGIDCSGLVQAALLACGIACPGDSDLQAGAVGTALEPDAPLERGDLVFWKGHVAMVADPDRLIHAYGHIMSTGHEGIADAISRISASGTPVLCRRRP